MFAINLESDTIYLHGSPEESAGTEVRGCVELCFKDTTRVKSINLQFIGLLKMNWEEDFAKATFPSPQRRQQCKLKKTIHQHDWILLPIRNLSYTMVANTVYRFPFDLVLSGDIMESITNLAGGSLTYEFKATVVRPFATKNLVMHRPLEVIRQLPSSVDGFYGFNDNTNSNNINNRAMIINKTYNDMVDYRIQLDSSVYQRGQAIPIHVFFKPLIQGLSVEHISCFLKEYTTLACPIDDSTNDDHVTLTGESALQSLSQQSRIISLARDDRFPCQGDEWKQTETVMIPRSARAVLVDSTHPLIHIEHKLRLTICFVQKNGHVSELRLTMPIKLLESTSSPSIAPTTFSRSIMNDTPAMGSDALPRYEDACLIAPYDPQLRFRASSSSTSPMVSPSPSIPSLVSLDDPPSPSYDESDYHPHQQTTPLIPMNGSFPIHSPSSCDYFSYQPSVYLQRVPSYETAIRTPF